MKRLFAATLLLMAFAAHAADGFSLEQGPGDRDVSLLRVGVHSYYQLQKLEPHNLHVLVEASLGYWSTDEGPIYDIATTPVFRYARSRNSGPYLEAAIGLHFLSDTHIKPDVTLSTHFQFGDHIGVGVRRDKYDVGIRLQHLSNAGLRNPNPGINFVLLRLAYELR